MNTVRKTTSWIVLALLVLGQSTAVSVADPPEPPDAPLIPQDDYHTYLPMVAAPPAIGDFVWEDLDADGIQDADEAGIEGVTIRLYDCGGTFITSALTDEDGLYDFTGLQAGCYRVDVDETTVPGGYALTTGNEPLTVHLGASQDYNDADFGYTPTGSIGDFVWQDLDGDGLPDGGEPGIGGATIRLYHCGGAFISSTLTDEDGLYTFADLKAGCYEVDVDEATLPSGYILTTGNEPLTVHLTAREDYDAADFGYIPKGSIGDFVWEDLDGDGVQDTGEFGIEALTVQLYDCGDTLVASTATDEDGLYDFTDLIAGCYEVRVDEATVPVGYVLTTANEPLTVYLSAGEDHDDADFGYTGKAAIGDRAWEDLDTDGIQDAGEPGMSGLTVELYGCDGGLVASTTTGGDGAYLFDDLPPGCYQVEFEAASPYVFSPQDAGTDDAADSDADPATGRTAQVTLGSGETDQTWDAGLYQPSATLGDFVWEDMDGNGVQGVGEAGVSGVTVGLYECDGSLAASITSGGDGAYLFEDIAPGCYVVEFAAPSGYVFSPQDRGSDDAADSDADPSTGRTAQVTLQAGQTDRTWDAGLYQFITLGDLTWEDLDADGIQDTGEVGIEGVAVALYGCGGAFVASTTTGADGVYLFDDLSPGCYVVAFEAPGGYVFSPRDQGTDDAVDSDANPATGRTPHTVLRSGGTDRTLDAGLYRTTALGDLVWEDLDANGVQDVDEPGIAGITVELYGCGGALADTTTTNADGVYLFDELQPGCYALEFTPPSGYTFSPQDIGTDDTVDSDADPSTGRTAGAALGSNQTDRTWDAGLYRPGALGDFVWEDLDEDGIQDAGEPGLAGVTVSLYEHDGGFIASTATGGDGSYGFSAEPGAYYVQFAAPSGYLFSPQDQSADDTVDSDADPATGQTISITLSSGENDPTWDAGLSAPVCDLVVTKTCQVAPAPTSFSCSDAKPIDELSMVWDGAQTVRILAWKGNVGSTPVAMVDDVAPGDTVTISGFAGSPNDVYWEIFAAGTSSKIGESVFHLSCSDPDMNGPEDCGKREGDGKDKSGVLNDWLFEGMAGNGLALVCTPAPPAPSDTCEMERPVPSCKTLDDPTSLTFRYTGGGCAASDHNQGDKAICSGSIDDTLAVWVTPEKDDYIVTPVTVEPGEEFTVTTDGFESTSILYLSNAGGTETDEIHTSCSQPLAVGDVFGSLTLVAFSGQRAGGEVTYGYSVTNSGSALTGVALTDDPLGDIAGPFDLDSGETRTFQTVAQIHETSTNTGTFSGLLPNTAPCSEKATATVTLIETCDECDGGVTELSLRYIGAAAALVQVYEGHDPNPDRLLFEGTVQADGIFSFTGIRSDGTMGTEIGLFVDGVENTRIHTSCSQPIGPGLVSNDFEVVEGYSKYGGRLCPLSGALTLSSSGRGIAGCSSGGTLARADSSGGGWLWRASSRRGLRF